ncbi:MAG: caspase family protein [Deltaproteobacteria bacterium]|jgi:hypothetical protein|nr:caspase family protein [Deltaproteobacteria bacterium]
MKKALVVGLNNYPKGNALYGCENDAVEITKRLDRHGNGDKNFDVAPIYGECSRADLKSAIDTCFQGSSEVALMYFAGHGMLDSFGGHIIATDDSNADLSLRDILEIVNTSKCANKVVILDSCFSGNETCSLKLAKIGIARRVKKTSESCFVKPYVSAANYKQRQIFNAVGFTYYKNNFLINQNCKI